ncbi:MAG: hypothetical protein V4760_12255 [Bdellovibrionota bacterium]
MIAFDKYRILHRFARVLETPRARAINESMRKLELHVLAPAILRRALLPWKTSVEFHFRHSVREAGEFNFLLSDVDFDLVLLRDFSTEESSHLNEALASVRKKFRFIGEAEVFSADEFRRLKSIETANGDVYSFLRWIRKLRWMEAVITSEREAYHRFKAERSNDITRKKIARHLGREANEDLSKSLGAWLDERFPASPALRLSRPVWIDYLGYWVAVEGTRDVASPILILTPEQVGALIALVPDIFHESTETTELAKALRAQDSRLLEAWHQMASIEELRQRAWGRTQTELPRDFATWVATLEGWRRSINP